MIGAHAAFAIDVEMESVVQLADTPDAEAIARTVHAIKAGITKAAADGRETQPTSVVGPGGESVDSSTILTAPR